MSNSRSFTNYSAVNSGWSGTLNSINQQSMYLIRSGQPKSVKVIGSTAKPVEYPIVIGSGWNWIGYVPQFVTPVKEALSSINPVEGDQIKGQIGFASYSGGRWNGSLLYLVPGQGYMLNSADASTRTLTYPSQYISKLNIKQKVANDQILHWTYNEYEFPQNMTITAIVKIDELEIANENLLVAAFIDNKCRSTINLILDPSTNRYYAYMTILGDGVTDLNKKITFKCYNPATGKELVASDNSLGYISDSNYGEVTSPYVIAFSTLSTDKKELTNKNGVIYPNPVVNTLNFNYNPEEIDLLEIVDFTGRIQVLTSTVNKNSIDVGSLTPGIYTLRVTSKTGTDTHRFVKK